MTSDLWPLWPILEFEHCIVKLPSERRVQSPESPNWVKRRCVCFGSTSQTHTHTHIHTEHHRSPLTALFYDLILEIISIPKIWLKFEAGINVDLRTEERITGRIDQSFKSKKCEKSAKQSALSRSEARTSRTFIQFRKRQWTPSIWLQQIEAPTAGNRPLRQRLKPEPLNQDQWRNQPRRLRHRRQLNITTTTKRGRQNRTEQNGTVWFHLRRTAIQEGPSALFWCECLEGRQTNMRMTKQNLRCLSVWLDWFGSDPSKREEGKGGGEEEVVKLFFFLKYGL